MSEPHYATEIERLKDCHKDYRSIAAQLSVYCSAAIFALRAANKDLEDAQVKCDIVPNPFAAQAVDDIFAQSLESLRDYPELMAIALKFIQEAH